MSGVTEPQVLGRPLAVVPEPVQQPASGRHLALNAAPFLSLYEARRGTLPGVAQAREAAAALLRHHGLPGRKTEAFRYTGLQPLAALQAGTPAPDAARAAALLEMFLGKIELAALPRAVFVNGRFDAALSQGLAQGPDGFAFCRFADSPAYGPQASPERQPLVALNTALAEDGVQIEVAAGADAGTLLMVSIGLGDGQAASFHPRHRFALGAGARLAVLDAGIGEGRYLHNPVAEVTLAEGAHLTHVRLQDESAEAYAFATSYASLAAKASYDSFCLTLGAILSRNEVHVHLKAPNAIGHVNGAQLLRGQQVGDLTSVISHDAPDCASRQTVKNVLSGQSRGVFQGKIEVARVAQKTDGYQMNQALLLSETAEMDAKPELEIYADDVKCSHGATIGALDEEQMFYLRSRGVPLAEARSILVHAFLSDAIGLVPEAPLRDALERAIAAWWQGAAAERRAA